ncbi:hypothetical protein QQ020_05670 [Fulvivirgaceae bacterium BMA12]|uniref:Uncharacterized protein n=1 Tax=Agaribacillus aureus TaxID=3051825 RepID=A0ABT8L1A4_9BACT|nr:hypothetical protein [Fulvivirgaceae bacterium BMA12]
MFTTSKPGTAFFAVLLIMVSSATCYAQVGEVIEKAKENKSGSSESSNDGDGDSGSFFFNIFVELTYHTIRGIPIAQREVLSRKYQEPWLVSLETGFSGGYATAHNTVAFLPSIQGNWGIFSSELRMNRLFDATGNFQTIDWQVLVFNLVNREKVRLHLGGGFSHHQKTSETFFEYSTGLKLFFKERSISPSISFRWAPDLEQEINTRFELNTQISKQIMKTDKFAVNVMAGLVYQKYFETTDFYFMQTGVSFNLF